MKRVLGILFLIVAFIGILYFKNYKGTIIHYPTLWYTSFIALGSLGIWLIYSSYKKVKANVEQYINTEIEKFRSSADKIDLDLDKCVFKSGSFSHEVEDPNLSTIKMIAPGSLGLAMDTTKTENVIQSYLIYTDTISGENSKFISHSFPMDPTTLKFHVMNHNIILYVDRFDRKKYMFDMKREL